MLMMTCSFHEMMKIKIYVDVKKLVKKRLY